MESTKKSKSLISIALSFCMMIGYMIPTYAATENKLISKWTFEDQTEEDTTIKNKVIKGWTFDSQAEFDSFVVDLSTGSKEYKDGAAKVTGSAVYTYPFDGMSLTVGKEYIVEFKTKTASIGSGGYLAVFYPDRDNGYCNFDADGNEAIYSESFTAQSENVPYIVMVGTAAYLDDIYLYEVTKPASIVSSNPSAGATVYPTNKIEIEFSDELSDKALDASSWTLTDSNGDMLAVSSVEKSGNKYTLNLASVTKNMMGYKLDFEGLKTLYNHPITTTSLEFVSYEGEIVIYHQFSSAETSTWQYLQNGSGNFYNTDEYYSAPGSRWFELDPSVEVYVKRGDTNGSDVPLVVGEEYSVSFWAKPYVENGADASNVNSLRLNEGDKQYVGNWSFSGNDWQLFTASFTQQGGGSLRFQFDRKDASLPVKMYVDDFKITKTVPLSDFEIVSSNPENETTAGIVDSITVNFTQTPGSSAADVANYSLVGGTQTIVSAKVTGNSVTLALSEPLTENTKYTLTMDIRDAVGRALVGRNTISFTSVAEVLYKNYLSTDADFERPEFKEHATKEGNAALFNFTNASDIYPFKNNSYVDTPLEIGKKYSIMFKAATTQEGNAQHFALVNGDNASFLTSIYDLTTEMKTYTVEFTANTTAPPFFRMYTADTSLGAKVLIDDIVLYSVPENELYLAGVKLFANYGTDSQNEIFGNSVVEGDISVVIDEGANCTGEDQNVMLAIAVYENDQLKDVSISKFPIENKQVIEDAKYATVKVDGQTDGVKRTVKTFVWNSETYKPYADSRVLND